jgi:hypothetical protein
MPTIMTKPTITQAQLAQFHAVHEKQRAAERKYQQLRSLLLAQHECGAKVEPGRFTLSITSAPFTPITRSALARVYGWEWMREVEAELPESKRTIVIVEEVG